MPARSHPHSTAVTSSTTSSIRSAADGDFAETEARAATNVRDAAAAAGLRRIVYLGGMGRRPCALPAPREPAQSGRDPGVRRHADHRAASGGDHRLGIDLVRDAAVPHRGAAGHGDTALGTNVVSRSRSATSSTISSACSTIQITSTGTRDRRSRRGHLRGNDADLRRGRRAAAADHHARAPAEAGALVALGGPRHPAPGRIAVPLIDSLRHEVVISDHKIDKSCPTAGRFTKPSSRTRQPTPRRSTHAGRMPGPRRPTRSPATRSGPAVRCSTTKTVDTDATPDAVYEGVRPHRRGERLLRGRLGVAASRVPRQARRRAGPAARPTAPGRSAPRRGARLLARRRRRTGRRAGPPGGDEGPGQGVAHVGGGREAGRPSYARRRGLRRRACSGACTGTRCSPSTQ